MQKELQQRQTRMMRGLQRYAQLPAPSKTEPTPYATLWQEGSSILRHYATKSRAKKQAPALFIVPSMINRPSILDLSAEHSFIRELTQRGHPVYLLDWGAPTNAEHGMDVEAYLTCRLLPAFQQAQDHAGARKITLLGYCMGGLLALATAQLLSQQQSAPHGLVLMATPWDYHSPDFPRIALDELHLKQLEMQLSQQQIIAGDAVQMLFYLTNPWVFSRKYMHFADTAEGSEEFHAFIARERWVNDTVDMTAPVARECLVDWIHRNAPLRGEWRVGGQTIAPSHLQEIPLFVVIPEHDHVVPPSCAKPLLRALPHATCIQPPCGHVGMVASPVSAHAVAGPLSTWVKNLR